MHHTQATLQVCHCWHKLQSGHDLAVLMLLHWITCSVWQCLQPHKTLPSGMSLLAPCSCATNNGPMTTALMLTGTQISLKQQKQQWRWWQKQQQFCWQLWQQWWVFSFCQCCDLTNTHPKLCCSTHWIIGRRSASLLISATPPTMCQLTLHGHGNMDHSGGWGEFWMIKQQWQWQLCPSL